MAVEFVINIYPSMVRPGQHAVSVTNNNDESIIIGFASNSQVDQVKDQLSKTVRGSWDFDSSVKCHSIKVVTATIESTKKSPETVSNA